MTARPASDRSIVAVATYTVGLNAFQQLTVVPALPIFERDLHASTAWTTWLLTAFLLASCLATPILGRLGDQFGARRMLLFTLVLFTVGCAVATVAPNIWVLIASRAVQGVASGASVPLGLTIVRQNLPRERSGEAIASIAVIIMIAGGLGATVAGVVVTYASWRYIFAISAVGAVVAVVLVARLVPPSPRLQSRRIDVAGAALLGLGLGLVLIALTEVDSWGFTSPAILGLTAAGVALLAVWVVVERRVPEPMVDTRMLVRRPVLAANAVQFLGLGVANSAAFLLVPRIVTTPSQYPPELARLVPYGLGATAAIAGLYLLPLSLGGLLARNLSVRLADRYGWRLVLALGPAVCSASLAGLALWHGQSWEILLGLLGIGLAHPMMSGTAAKFVVEGVRPEETGVAVGMSSAIRQVGAAVGAQAMASVLSTDTIPGTSIPAESAFVLAFAVAAVAAAVAVATARIAPPPRAA